MNTIFNNIMTRHQVDNISNTHRCSYIAHTTRISANNTFEINHLLSISAFVCLTI